MRYYHALFADPARPFDFLVDGELLRKNLEQHLLDKQISAVRLPVPCCNPHACMLA